jgi:CRP/FNR family transcriptional regulator, nitrogen oxide reductase regulator
MPEIPASPVVPETLPDHCSLDVRLDRLGRAPLFADLSAADLAQVSTQFHEHSYAAGAPLYLTGDPAQALFVLAAGKVKLTRHTFSGQDVLLEILAPGDTCGSLALLGDPTYPDTAVAMTPVCALTIDVAAFAAVLRRYPAVTLAALAQTAGRLQTAQATIRELSAQPVEQRIAAILLRLADKLGRPAAPGLVIQVPLTRQELAEMAGATVETASRVVSRWERAGLVQTGRQWIALADRAGLSALVPEQTL